MKVYYLHVVYTSLSLYVSVCLCLSLSVLEMMLFSRGAFSCHSLNFISIHYIIIVIIIFRRVIRPRILMAANVTTKLWHTPYIYIYAYVYWVTGQNGSGQNGTDKMVWTKWYTDKMVLDKMVWTKRYGQNGTDKILRINYQSIPFPLTI